jgi:nicotinamide riboside kinase
LTGPESTGKTHLSEQLAARYNACLIPEYAREYISGLRRPYSFDDVVYIAKEQVKQMNDTRTTGVNLAIFDTYLVITKVWFEVVFKQIPGWIDDEIRKSGSALYLLCKPDIPWVPDKLRENGGQMRHILFEKYKKELLRHKLNFQYIEGDGEHRLESAIKIIDYYIRNK